ncbi:hypothetical protein BBW65_06990 [Helicobacter enhydrae]|uniref:Uncharacterized protein n=1 Tax=Helicobacter enhydrae TaxID=222136 RepID=A0A1B1U6Y4_9HELI|nr:hypothetical protein BBW65_06990 [Helicobacter enhydrae]
MFEFFLLFCLAVVLVAFFNPPKPKPKEYSITIHIRTSLYKPLAPAVDKDQTSCKNPSQPDNHSPASPHSTHSQP